MQVQAASECKQVTGSGIKQASKPALFSNAKHLRLICEQAGEQGVEYKTPPKRSSLSSGVLEREQTVRLWFKEGPVGKKERVQGPYLEVGAGTIKGGTGCLPPALEWREGNAETLYPSTNNSSIN